MKRWKKWSAKSAVIFNSTISGIALLLLAAYRGLVSPVVTACFGNVCRFQPTCSVYAQIAFKNHPPLTAGWLTLRRLCKCHPLGSFGFDPVPERKSS